MVTSHMTRGTRIKYSRSKRRELGEKGYRITRLHNNNRQGRLLGCSKLEEINILTSKDSHTPMWGRCGL